MYTLNNQIEKSHVIKCIFPEDSDSMSLVIRTSVSRSLHQVAAHSQGALPVWYRMRPQTEEVQAKKEPIKQKFADSVASG